MAFPLTREQRQIVDDRGGQLLVSAAAGSGKTRVLVERLLDRVTEEGLDIDRFLVITYTKAAAAELRTRIAQELASRLADAPNNRHLRRQTTLVYQAQISTIHSFCSMVIRENGHGLDLDPDFRLCDEGEGQVLMARVLEEVLDKRYETLALDSPFSQLVDTLAAGRDDSRLAQIVLDISARIQSHPQPERWLMEQHAAWDLAGVSDMGQTPWGKLLLEHGRRSVHWCAQRLEQALAMSIQDELLAMNYAPSIAATIECVEHLCAAQSWDQVVACLPISFPPVGRKKKRSMEQSPMEQGQSEQLAQRVKAIRTRCKKQLEKVEQTLEGDSATLIEELSLSRPAVQALMELVIDFQRAYAKEKIRRSMLDFSDLEHCALKLLLDEGGAPSPLAHSWARRFDEVLVDEYQDTNQVQNAIFFAISQQGRKLFQVGDVKQSIYRFRLADPTIFLDKYRRFPSGEEAQEGQPRRRVLSQNFRSRPQVLEGCNDLFRNIMSTEFGELDYTDDQALVPGATFPEGEAYALELAALDLSFLGDQEGEKDNKDFLEARFAARRIKELLEKPLMITHGDGLRPLRPSDIMILLRSPGSVLHHYLRALEEEGIPWSAAGGEDLFSSTEINVALSILQIVDNPRQDVPLIAALRSPIYGFTGDQLAQLRSKSKGDFYTALTQDALGGNLLSAAFLAQLDELRFGAGDKTCRQLIWHIYEKTNLLGIFGAMEGGKERQDNLLALYGLAGQLERAGCGTLFQFLLRLERLRDTGTRMLTPGGSGREGEGVSILSIHRSKGLEKPVVLVCGLSRRLNRVDLMRPVLFHPILGVGPKGLDRKRMVEYPTLARRAVERQLEREMMAEELRLLYVAMTRAKEKLILTLALPEGVRVLERLGEEISIPVSPMALAGQQNVGQWILLHGLTRPEAAPLRELAGLPEVVCEHLGPAWDIRWVDGLPLSEDMSQAERLTDLLQEGEEIVDLLDTLMWQYPHMDSATIPSKLTATQMKGRQIDHEVAQEATPIQPAPPQSAPIYRPSFVVEAKGLTPAQRGIALHQAMQYLPLQGDHSPRGIQQELERLVEQRFLTKEQGAAVSPQRLSAFFFSELGQAMGRAKQCAREFKFSILVPAQEYFPQAGEGEQVLLQGVIDAWFDTGEQVTVVDFKSDRVAPGEEKTRGEEYRPQLSAYSHALSEMLNRPVTRRVLWFFATDCAVEL